MAKKKEETLIKEEEYMVRWTDTYFNCNFNGRITSKFLKPHLSLESAEVDAARMLGKDRIKELIAIKQQHIRIKEEISLAWIVSELKEIITDVKSQSDERDATGKLIARADTKSRLAAIAQLSKIAGFETKKIDVTTNGESINKITWIEQKTYDKEE